MIRRVPGQRASPIGEAADRIRPNKTSLALPPRFEYERNDDRRRHSVPFDHIAVALVRDFLQVVAAPLAGVPLRDGRFDCMCIINGAKVRQEKYQGCVYRSRGGLERVILRVRHLQEQRNDAGVPKQKSSTGLQGC